MARRKSGEEKVVKFNACNATHYRNIALNLSKRVGDLREGIAAYNGLTDDPDLVDAIDTAEAATRQLMLVLNSKSSKPLEG